MENLNKALELLTNNSTQLLNVGNNGKKEVSRYGYGEVSTEILAKCFILIKKSFPKLPDGWYDVLEKMLDVEKFTDQRLTDATMNLIKTCQYPEPTIANIINYDKTKKIYTADDILQITKDFSVDMRRSYVAQFDWDEKLKKYIEK